MSVFIQEWIRMVHDGPFAWGKTIMTSSAAENLSPYIDVTQRLRRFGISPTRQRLQIAMALFDHGGHLSAQDLFALVNHGKRSVCRATVYNTLHLFVSRGLVREISLDSSRTFYDTNTQPHHHVYNMDTGELIDIAPETVEFKTFPAIPADTQHEEITLIIRVRNRSESVRAVSQ